MSKKILSIVLAIVLVMSTFVTVAFAATNYENDEDKSTNKQIWSLTNVQETADGYTVDVKLTTNYPTGVIEFVIVEDDANGVIELTDVTIGAGVPSTYKAELSKNLSKGKVFIVPQTEENVEAVTAVAIDGVVATLTYSYTGSGKATIAIDNDPKTAENPAGTLIAARMGDASIVSEDMIVGQSVVDTNGAAITGDITPTELGKEEAATFTVSFDANGGSGEMDNVVMEAGDYVLPENTFTAPTGYAFKAWDVNGTEYAAGATVAIATDTTVKAVWEMLTPVLSGANTSVVIDTRKTFGGTYKGAIYGFTSSRYNGASLKGQLVVENGTITVTGNGTGAEIKVFDLNGDLYETYVAVVFGDVDGTGTINTNDVAALRNSIGGTNKLVANTPAYMAANLASAFNRAHNTNDLATLKNRVSSTGAFTQSAMGANHTYSN